MSVSIVKRLGNRGDTIVEVLLALAVLGSALGIGYATANNSLKGTVQAQEHSQALKIAQDQAERLQANNTLSALYTSTPYCLTSANTKVPVTPPGSCTDNNLYNKSIVYTGSSATDPNGYFTITVSWASIKGTGNDKVQLNYKVHQPVAGSTSFGGGGFTVASTVINPGDFAWSYPSWPNCYGPRPVGGPYQYFVWCSGGDPNATATFVPTINLTKLTITAAGGYYPSQHADMYVIVDGVQIADTQVPSDNSTYTYNYSLPSTLSANNTHTLKIYFPDIGSLYCAGCGPGGSTYDVNLLFYQGVFNP